MAGSLENRGKLRELIDKFQFDELKKKHKNKYLAKGEKQMINLRKITEDNFLDAFRLKLAEGQEEYVSHPIRSLAQAYVCLLYTSSRPSATPLIHEVLPTDHPEQASWCCQSFLPHTAVWWKR